MGGHNGVKKGLFENAETAQGLAGLYGSNAAAQNSILTPTLTNQAVNPQGYNPTELGQMTTAAEQTAGGSNAGATGQALLRAARTRNIGSGQAATSEAARGASQRLSQVNAGIQSKNADLKETQREKALSGLGSLYGENTSAQLGALNSSNAALSTAGNLKNFWQEYLLNAQKAASEMAAAGA